MTGELPVSHCASGATKKPASSTPRSFFHCNLPFRSYAYSPSDPKNATRCLPSVASVELACVDFGWRLILGTPVYVVCCQIVDPLLLSRQATRHSWEVSS